MSQIAPPIDDGLNMNWATTPLYPKLAELYFDDTTFVQSSADPQGDTFEVYLKGLAWPNRGPKTLRVRLRTVGPAALKTTVTLIQGSGGVIATRTLEPGSSFAELTIVLSATEEARITNYNDLRVRVTAGSPKVTCCGNTISARLNLTLSNGTGTCGGLNGTTIPLIWNGQFWDGSGGNFTQLALQCVHPGWHLYMAGCITATESMTAFSNCGPPLQMSKPNILVPLGSTCCAGTIDVTISE